MKNDNSWIYILLFEYNHYLFLSNNSNIFLFLSIKNFK